MRVLGLACLVVCLGCPEPRRAALHSYVLRGTVVTPDHVIPNGSVLVEGSTITQVAPGDIVAPPSGAPVIDVDGIIFPGMIDLHDHLVWNVFPRWQPGVLFANRYEWQATRAYFVALKDPEHALRDEVACDMNRYAEVKAIAGGATTVAGSLGQPCEEGLTRNLDGRAGFRTVASLRYEVFPLRLDDAEAAELRDDMASGAAAALLAHVAEGTDSASRAELDTFMARGFFRRRATIIHGIALKAQDFELMADSVGLVWSPRSNAELYGRSADVAAAKAAGVTIALGPDWSPTGSSGMLNELRYAAHLPRGRAPPVFSDSELVLMTTSVPARLARAEQWIGSIEPGHYADLIVLRTRRAASAYGSIVESGPADLRLVIVGGEVIYGAPDLMAKVAPGHVFETRTVCGENRAFNLARQGTGATLAATEQTLKAQLSEHNSSLAPLQECP